MMNGIVTECRIVFRFKTADLDLYKLNVGKKVSVKTEHGESELTICGVDVHRTSIDDAKVVINAAESYYIPQSYIRKGKV